jgi:sec-independent protein translocase protein TatA
MFSTFGLPELLVILVIVLVLFGVGRISKISGEIGKSIRSFREGIKSSEEKKDEPSDKPKEP